MNFGGAAPSPVAAMGGGADPGVKAVGTPSEMGRIRL
jgi:hypothetical protein